MYQSSGVPVIRGCNLPDNSRFDKRELVFVSEQKADQLRQHEARPGDLVFTQRGTLGQVGLIPRDAKYPRYIVSQSQMKLTVDQQKVDALFLYYVFRSPSVTKRIEDLALRSGVPHINLAILRAFEVDLPPLDVQRRIASILGAYDDLIEANRRRVTVLDEMAQRLFEEWFVRFQFPGHHDYRMVKTSDGSLPEGWQRGVLGDLIGLAYGRALKADARIPGSVPVIGSSGVVGWHNEPLVKGPGVIVGRKGNVGAIIWSPVDFYPIDTVFFVETSRPILFVLQQLRRLVFLNTDAAVPGLNRNAALSIPLTIPPAELMMEYQDKAAPMLKLVDQLRNSNSLLAASRDLLLPTLISGKLSVIPVERDLDAVA
jgi:type I restriction enzyme S subunit